MLQQLQEGIRLMLFGMSGVFIVTGIVYLTMRILASIDRK